MRLTFLILPILLLIPNLIFPSIFVISKGCSIMKDSTETARILALEEAKKIAVEKAIGISIKSTTKVMDNLLMDYRIEEEVEGRIEKYVVINEWKEEGMLCVEIGAFVEEGDSKYEIGIVSSETRFLPFFREALENNGFLVFEKPVEFFNSLVFNCKVLFDGDVELYGEKLKHVELGIDLSLNLPDGSVRRLDYRIVGNGFDENQAFKDAFERSGWRISKDLKSAFDSSRMIFMVLFLSNEDELLFEKVISEAPNVLNFEKLERGLGDLYRIKLLGDPVSLLLRIGREFGDRVSVIRRGGIYELRYSRM